MFLDRRTKKREAVRTISEYRVLEVPKYAKFKKPRSAVKTSLLDISIGGCALDSPMPIPEGAIILVRIDPLAFAIEALESRKDPLEMTGMVASCITKGEAHYRLGISFKKIRKRDIELIKLFMKIKERRKFPRWDMSRA